MEEQELKPEPEQVQTPVPAAEPAAAPRRGRKRAKRRRSLKETAELFLSMEVADQKVWNQLAAAYAAPGEIDNQLAMVAGLVHAAEGGSASAAKIVLELLGEDEKNRRAGGEVRIVDDL